MADARVRLQVARAMPQDVGRGTARLGPEALHTLGRTEGSVIEIVGTRNTAAIALRLPFEDRKLPLLRIDGLQRANAGVSIGDQVEVRPAVAKPAEHITMAPTEPDLRLTGAADALRSTLLRRVLVAGDHLVSTSVGDQPAFGLREIRLRSLPRTRRGS